MPHGLNVSEGFSDVTPSIEAKGVKPFLAPAFTASADEPNKIIAVMSHEHDMRMFVQQGCFTVHSDRSPLNKKSACSTYLRKLEISANHVHSLQAELNMCGIRKGDIFPDLEHLAQELKEAVVLPR